MPPRLQPRELASGKILYYYQAGGKKIPLGEDLDEARKEWARLETGASRVLLFPAIADLFTKALFSGFSASTQDHYQRALENLKEAFQAFALEQIEPKHVKEYMRRRTKKGAALFEKRVLSAVFNWSRGEGYTSASNPCRDIKFSKAEKKTYTPLGKRDKYVTDEEFQAVYSRADELVRDMMDLAHLTGQRPSDLLKARRQDIQDGVLTVVQQKTGAVVRIKIEGALEPVLSRILLRPKPVQSVYILADQRGQRYQYAAFGRRFREARGADKWQFRDLRAKTATESDNLKDAQELLGHANEQTTAGVYRRSKGGAVSPLKRKNLEPI